MEFGPLEIGALLGLAGGSLLWLDKQRDKAHAQALDWADRRLEGARIATQGQVDALAAVHQSQYPALQQAHFAAPVSVPPSVTTVDTPQLPAAGLPGITTLGATGFRPTPGAILLGLGPGGVPLTVPAGDALCHIAFAGPTGVGKTNLMRLLLTQLEAAGLEVYLCDPHYSPVHPHTGEDWRGIAAGTVPGRAITDRSEIATLIAGLGAELDRRLACWHAGTDPGPARFYAVEELPLLAQEDRAFMERLGRILREGRKLGLYVITAMQDALISTIGGSSGLRSQFQTVYFGGNPGTDPTTARALLGSAKLPAAPGKGVVWLRSAATAGEPQLVRVPLVENRDIVALLGEVVNPVSARFRPVSAAPIPVSAPVSPLDVLMADETDSETAGIDPTKRAAVVAGLRAKRPYGDLISEIWGVKAGGGQGYKAAYAEWQAILADLVGEG